MNTPETPPPEPDDGRSNALIGLASERSHGREIEQVFRELMGIHERECNDLYQFGSLIAANQYRRLYGLANEYAAPGMKVLDWGCGNGHFSYALLRFGYEVFGYSFDDFCLRKYLDETYEFIQGNAGSPSALPYPNGFFDAVFSVGVLEHVRETGGNEVASLREIFRILRPSGHFVCYHFPNRYTLVEAMAAYFPEKHLHRYRYTQRSIIELCRQAGLDLLRVQRYGFLPRNEWNRLPWTIRNARLVAGAWNLLDNLLSYPFSILCQNYLFVAKKPPEG